MVKPPINQTPIEIFITWIGSIPSMIFHSILFTGFLVLTIGGPFPRDTVLLVWNTIVSLEAIYLAIFIQFTVNRNTTSLREVEEDIDEIQEDVEGLGEDMGEIQEDIEEISEDLDEIQEDVGEVQKDIDEVQKDIEEMSDEEVEEEKLEKSHTEAIDALTTDIRRILTELESMKKK